MRTTALRGLVLASGMGLAACSIDLSGPTPIPIGGVPVPPSSLTAQPSPTPSPTPALATAPTDPPTPLTPAAGAAVSQNDPSLAGCGGPYPERGHGFHIEFSWEDAPSSPLPEKYELVATKVGAAAPILNRPVLGTDYSFVSCGGFVADTNLDGWEWKVRAVGEDGTTSPWSPAVPFRFLPCRVDGRPCSS